MRELFPQEKKNIFLSLQGSLHLSSLGEEEEHEKKMWLFLITEARIADRIRKRDLTKAV